MTRYEKEIVSDENVIEELAYFKNGMMCLYHAGELSADERIDGRKLVLMIQIFCKSWKKKLLDYF